MIPMIPAVSAEVVIDPARATINRRTPERLTKNGADDPSGNSANRTRYQKARTRAGGCANHIGTHAQRGNRETSKDRYSQSKNTHAFPPVRDVKSGAPEKRRLIYSPSRRFPFERSARTSY